jgi:hypothetical protein
MWCYKTDWGEHEIAIIKYLRTYTMIPVPEIFQHDLTCNNKIGLRYTIQSRIMGESALKVYPTLNHLQKLHLVKELALAIREMWRRPLQTGGVLNPASILQDINCLTTVRFDVPCRNSLHYYMNSVAVPLEIPSPMEGPLDMMKSLFARQYEQDVKYDGVEISPWPAFIRIAEHMDRLGLFEDEHYYLTHMDFEPRNMMIHVEDQRTATLAGILDWDDAVFAPAFLNCTPPQWLWNWQEGVLENETRANDIPFNMHDWEIKHAFEAAVGHPYVVYAYSPVYQIARRMLVYGIQGISSTESFDDSDNLVLYWNRLYPDLSVQRPYLHRSTETRVDELGLVGDESVKVFMKKGAIEKEFRRRFLNSITKLFGKG